MFKLGCRRTSQLLGEGFPASLRPKMYRFGLSPLLLRTAHSLGHTPPTRHCQPPRSRHLPAASFSASVHTSAQPHTRRQHSDGKAADTEILSIHDDPGAEPFDHELSLPDVTEENLEIISKGRDGVEYLSEAPSSKQPSYAPKGLVRGTCRRLFINLVCVFLQVLGMWALEDFGWSALINWKKSTFVLAPYDRHTVPSEHMPPHTQAAERTARSAG
ncbi:unnamed protein product [Vitrella brassicaformis CCMP3155]|uniref:Uncharacterized protein n=1 Tax=Vitrella brassicaformis (strain CCMP3155) TaxID=1169540 RepID=A0A0G4EB27_VITBC|nr:unnamed protein product [Vitrella brassicaformis CCMP3155]|mmetsp:Transcript_25320/g.62678  ORF Transcript_25320/g.62678 Transcript_25320/m.62678 type:complete len:216 (-) Transcript_25320:1123-1770(-)|eukprot:CEL92691.1 unnamed protein product [Vitrella brassicaformis CCMP3155]